LKEDVEMRCNFLATSFVKKELKTAHHQLVQRLIEKAHVTERERYNMRLFQKTAFSETSGTTSPTSLSIEGDHSMGTVSPLASPTRTSYTRAVSELNPIELDANKPAVELPSEKEPAELGG